MIYSIGHGNKSIQDFVSILKTYKIRYLIDVRTNPYSKYNPQFNKTSLKDELSNNQIIYVFLGDKLGGLPDDNSCYINGKVDYNIIKDKDFFQEGMNRLIIANDKAIDIVVMCSETKPEECHRSKLIGQELLKNGIVMNHIITDKITKDQNKIMIQLTKGKGVIDMFGNELNFTSRKKYL